MTFEVPARLELRILLLFDESMDAFVCTKLERTYESSLQHVTRQTLSVPAPGPHGEVVVAVVCAGLNFFDGLILESKYQHRQTPPFVPLCEFAGIVTVVGKGSRFHVGDRVCGFVDRRNGHGSLSEYSVCSDAAIWEMPSNMTFEDGAAFVSNFGTSYMALIQRAQLGAKQTVLITAASGGMGSSCVQIAKAMGCRHIIGCVGTESKRQIALRNGCSAVLNYSENPGWSERIKREYGGVDVFVDIVGGNAFEQGLKCMNMLGKVVVIGFTSGDIPTVKMNRILLKNIDIIGVRLGATAMKDFKMYRGAVTGALKLYEKGALRPMIGNRYGFDIESIRRLYRDLMERKSVGKLVVIVSPNALRTASHNKIAKL